MNENVERTNWAEQMSEVFAHHFTLDDIVLKSKQSYRKAEIFVDVNESINRCRLRSITFEYIVCLCTPKQPKITVSLASFSYFVFACFCCRSPPQISWFRSIDISCSLHSHRMTGGDSQRIFKPFLIVSCLLNRFAAVGRSFRYIFRFLSYFSKGWNELNASKMSCSRLHKHEKSS